MNEQEFISKCMSELKNEFKDVKQRYAVCKKKWNEGRREMTNENEILIFPRGRFFVEKYNEWFDFNDEFFKEIIDTFKNSNLPKPFIDFDHEEGESCGEVYDIYITNEGLKGKIELTENGRNILKNKAYRYISPAWGSITDNFGKIWNNYLKSISLTNIPALMILKPLSEQLTLNNKEAKKMKKINFELSQLTDDAIRKVVEDLIAQGEKDEEIIKSLEMQLNELKKKLEETIKEKETLEKENTEIKEQVLNQEAEEFLKKQLEEKKIEMSLFDYWKEEYKKDKDKTRRYFELLSNSKKETFTKMSTKFNLTDEDILVMKSVKLNPNDERDIEFYLSKGGRV